MRLSSYLFAVFAILSSCNRSEKQSEVIQSTHGTHNISHIDSAGQKIYWCPMDTQIVSNSKGKCPICGMALELKPVVEKLHAAEGKDWVYTPVNVSVLSSVRSIKGVKKSLPVKIKVSGNVSYNKNSLKSIASKVSGRIEKLNVKYNFQSVKKGDLLLEVFSHELQTAQEEFLFIKQNDPLNSDLLNSAKRKLLLLGMSDQQINTMQSADHVHATTQVFSPYSGFIIEKEMQEERINPSASMNGNPAMATSASVNTEKKETLLREGAYVNRGGKIFTIVNNEVVWGIFELHTDQLSYLKKNQKIYITPESSNKTIIGKIDFIEPFYKNGTGTIRIRVNLQNKNQELKIGDLLSAEIEAGERQGLWIPLTALYDLGKSKIVFIKRNGAYETSEVTIGYSDGKEIEITGGLKEGEEIAGNAQFLIDSESFIKVRK